MASTAHIGESRALVFPVMCNGYLKLDYSDHNTADYKHNFWNHKDEPFTLEAIITPFDVNGIGHRSSGQGRLDSIKTPPSPNSSLTQSDYQSVDYFGSGRNTHKMMLFHNPYFQFYLQNTTSSNFNQPAEYKLVVRVAHGVSGGSVNTVETEKVFVASNRLKGYYDQNGLYQQKGIVTDKTKLSSSVTTDGTPNTFTVGSGEADGVGAGNLIYDNTGTLIGTVSSVSGNNITLTASPATTITSTTYISQKKEALYLEKTSKVSCTFDRGTVSIYLDNNLLIRKRIYAIDFEFDDVDCYIGQDGSNTNTQFMGELYEIAMHKGLEPCRTISTLTPNYGDTMFYYSFGD